MMMIDLKLGVRYACLELNGGIQFDKSIKIQVILIIVDVCDL